MTDPKSKSDKDAGNLSESALTHLTDIYVSTKYNRQTDISNRYIQKGLMVEEDSITLYSRVKKKFYKKNAEHLKNEFIQGTPDMYAGKSIHEADHIIDVKSSWDIFTFFRTLTKKMNSDYYWQLQGYMALTGAKSSTLAYCLVDTPEVLIVSEKRSLFYKMGIATDENRDYMEACEQLEKVMKYDDIPLKDRVIEFAIDRNDDDINRLYERIKKARIHLNELEKKFNPQTLIAA